MNNKTLQLTKPVAGKEEVDAVAKVFESGWLAEGKVTRQFEEVVAQYVDASYGIAVCNCTVALELCLKASGVKGVVAIPGFTHPATVNAVCNVGAIPVLYDVSLDTYLMKNPIYPQDTAIPVSWGGNPIENYPIETEVIEDAACSLGSNWNGFKTGSKQTACFSFHPRKLVTTGEGGMVTTNGEELAQRLHKMKNFGFGGGNYKFDDIRAAIGLAQMNKLEGIIAERIRMAKVYDDLLRTSQDITPPQKADGVRHTYQTYAVYLKKGNRNEIINRLAEKNIEVQRGAYALHLLPEYDQCKRIGDLHNSELLHHNLLALPMAYDITEEDQKFVVEELTEACNH